MPHKISLTVFLAIILSANSQTYVEPHKLTGSEVKKDPKVPLKSLLSPNENTDYPFSKEPAGPLQHLPKGTNLEAGPHDSVRYIMHGYTICNTMLIFLECRVQAGVARGGGWTVPSLWVDMPGQTGWWWVVTLPTYNATLVQVLQAS